MNYKITLFFVSLLLISCKDNQNNNGDFDDYDYEIKTLTNLNRFDSSDFYKNDTLIRSIKDESCTSYYYKNGKLFETKWGRQCPGYVRTIFIYDENGNNISAYTTLNTDIDLDTLKFDQTKFYNRQNQLIRELIHEFKSNTGERSRYWREYTYKFNMVDKEFTFENKDLKWKGQYYYDSKGNLVRKERYNNGLFEKEYFTYDKKNRLIKEEIVSTENPINEEITHSAGNNYKIYKYDSNGFLVECNYYTHKKVLYNTKKYVKIPFKKKNKSKFNNI